MLYVYQGSTSVCSVKVRLALEEKALAFEGKILDLQHGDRHRPDYAKLSAENRRRFDVPREESRAKTRGLGDHVTLRRSGDGLPPPTHAS